MGRPIVDGELTFTTWWKSRALMDRIVTRLTAKEQPKACTPPELFVMGFVASSKSVTDRFFAPETVERLLV